MLFVKCLALLIESRMYNTSTFLLQQKSTSSYMSLLPLPWSAWEILNLPTLSRSCASVRPIRPVFVALNKARSLQAILQQGCIFSFQQHHVHNFPASFCLIYLKHPVPYTPCTVWSFRNLRLTLNDREWAIRAHGSPISQLVHHKLR